MENLNNNSKFIEPTKKYVEEWTNSFMGDNIKFWFNLDLIHASRYIGNLSEDEFFKYYIKFCNYHEFNLTSDELIEFGIKFSDEEYSEMLKKIRI